MFRDRFNFESQTQFLSLQKLCGKIAIRDVSRDNAINGSIMMLPSRKNGKKDKMFGVSLFSTNPEFDLDPILFWFLLVHRQRHSKIKVTLQVTKIV